MKTENGNEVFFNDLMSNDPRLNNKEKLKTKASYVLNMKLLLQMVVGNQPTCLS